MKSKILFIGFLIITLNCKQSEKVSPLTKDEISVNKLIGQWMHNSTIGSIIYDRVTIPQDRGPNGEILIFKNNGVCNCFGYNNYTLKDSIITFNNTTTEEKDEVYFSVTSSEFIIKQTTEQAKKYKIRDKLTFYDLKMYFKKVI